MGFSPGQRFQREPHGPRDLRAYLEIETHDGNRQRFDPVVRSSFHYHYARLIELLQSVDWNDG